MPLSIEHFLPALVQNKLESKRKAEVATQWGYNLYISEVREGLTKDDVNLRADQAVDTLGHDIGDVNLGYFNAWAEHCLGELTIRPSS